MARPRSFRAAVSVRKARPPTSSRFHVIAVLRQPWQRARVPSGICRRPCSNTKQPPQRFPSRRRVRPTACKPPFPQRQSAGSRLQRADLGLESPSYIHLCLFVSIRVHSWFNVTPAFPFASSREANSPQTPLPAAAVRRQPVAEGRSRAGKPELRLIESGVRGH